MTAFNSVHCVLTCVPPFKKCLSFDGLTSYRVNERGFTISNSLIRRH